MRNAGLEEGKTGIKIAGRNQWPQICRWHHPYGRKRRRTKEPLDKGERGEWKSWLKTQKTKIVASGPIISWQIDGEMMETVRDFISGGSKITADGDCNYKIKRRLHLGRKAMTNLDSVLKSKDITLPAKVHLVKAMVFPAVTYGCELDHKEGWVLKNWCFWTVVLEKTLKSPLNCKEMKAVNPKGNQSWIFIGRTDTEAETPILWPPDAKNWLIRKDPDGGKDWRQGETGMTKDEMVGWHHRLNGHEFGQTPGEGEGQGSLVCCTPWDHKESDKTVWLNNNRSSFFFFSQIFIRHLCANLRRISNPSSYPLPSSLVRKTGKGRALDPRLWFCNLV